MNFINWEDSPATGLDLKYCERCGGLWLRLQGDSEVYCSNCRARMAQMARPPAERKSHPRLPRPHPDDIQCQCQIKSLHGVVEVEVQP